MKPCPKCGGAAVQTTEPCELGGLLVTPYFHCEDCGEDMGTNECQRCDGKGWVCEAHEDRPWPGCECRAAGAPCPDCNGGSDHA
jgi:hypothetical protein